MDKYKERKSEMKRLRKKAIKMHNNSAGTLPMADAMRLVRKDNENSNIK